MGLIELGTPAGRRRSLDALTRGIPAANAALGTAIPVPRLVVWDPATLDDDAARDPDVHHQRLLGALFDTPVPAGERGWTALVPAIAALVPGPIDLARPTPVLIDAARRSDGELLELVGERFAIEAVDPWQSIDDDDRLYAKINHGFWEDVALVALREAGLPYVRPHSVWQEYVDSRFPELVARLLVRTEQANRAAGHAPGTLSVPRGWFGVSYTNGDTRAAEDLVDPLHPVARGAMLGMLHLFAAAGLTGALRLADGCLGKELFADGRLDAVVGAAAAASEVVLVIGPAHLGGVRVRGFRGRTEHLVVPARWVDTLWPVVVPIVLATLDELLQAGRVTVIAQASVMGGLLGPVLKAWRASRPGSTLRYLDLGQVLDVAVPTHPDAGGWVRKPRIAARIAQFGPSILEGADGD